jgi:hypothetical protein
VKADSPEALASTRQDGVKFQKTNYEYLGVAVTLLAFIQEITGF